MLSINVSELVLTVLNFFLLLFVLDRLLFKPIIGFMDARQARIDAGLEKERRAAQALDEDRQRNEALEETGRKQARELLESLKSENLLRRSQMEEQVQRKENAAQKKVEERIERIEARERTELAEEDGQLAEVLAHRLLHGQD